MGRVAEEWSDYLVITSDNPRSEEPMAIIREVSAGLRRPDEAELVVDRREAIGLGIRMARPHDTVLIAGKGHETYQESKGLRTHFDDREVARGFLGELGLWS
jgi:UDP-N-acetylmuramoyl-L-alanyl-D-glutamate--2,6-diaminopimelate ligase